MNTRKEMLLYVKQEKLFNLSHFMLEQIHHWLPSRLIVRLNFPKAFPSKGVRIYNHIQTEFGNRKNLIKFEGLQFDCQLWPCGWQMIKGDLTEECLEAEGLSTNL